MDDTIGDSPSTPVDDMVEDTKVEVMETEVEKSDVITDNGAEKTEVNVETAEEVNVETAEEVKDECMDEGGNDLSSGSSEDGEDDEVEGAGNQNCNIRIPKVYDEPVYDESLAVLSWYDSDLNLLIDKSNFRSAKPMSEAGFGLIWAGARATFGYRGGALAYRVKVHTKKLNKPEQPCELRLGWSVGYSSMQLGECPLSYGYGSSGTRSTDSVFTPYGKTFTLGDVITAYLDLESDPIFMSFHLNGEDLGEAFSIPRSDLGDKALFPHVIAKGVGFTCDFYGREDPLAEGYTCVGKAAEDKCVSGPKRAEKLADCELLMMCGLPRSGKTTWAYQHARDHPEKCYNIIGTDTILERMKVDGKECEAKEWRSQHPLCQKSVNQCLIKLMALSKLRLRNYILDQASVFPNAQRKKMRGCRGYLRRAVVVLPSDEEYERRFAKAGGAKEGDVPISVLQMKANFTLPEVCDIFNEVVFADLEKKDAQELVEKYNKEGQAAGHMVMHRDAEPSKRKRRPGAGQRHAKKFAIALKQSGAVYRGPKPSYPRGTYRGVMQSLANRGSRGRGVRGNYAMVADHYAQDFSHMRPRPRPRPRPPVECDWGYERPQIPLERPPRPLHRPLDRPPRPLERPPRPVERPCRAEDYARWELRDYYDRAYGPLADEYEYGAAAVERRYEPEVDDRAYSRSLVEEVWREAYATAAYDYHYRATHPPAALLQSRGPRRPVGMRQGWGPRRPLRSGRPGRVLRRHY